MFGLELFSFIVGYLVCVLVPIPAVNRWIIDKWAQLWAWIKSKF